jgi:hypothetical protein
VSLIWHQLLGYVHHRKVTIYLSIIKMDRNDQYDVLLPDDDNELLPEMYEDDEAQPGDDEDDAEMPDEIKRLLQQVSPVVITVFENATALSGNDHMADSTRYQIDTFHKWMITVLSLLNITWDKTKEPCPVYGLLTVLEISGTEKGKKVCNSSVLGCGHSLSQLQKVRKCISKINEENGFTQRKMYPSDYFTVYLRDECMNTAHHSLIKRCMAKYTKKISRREIQAQPFLRYHLIAVRKRLMEKGLYGVMVYTGILVAFWLSIRIGLLVTIRIENIEVGADNYNDMGLPLFLKIKIKMHKTSNAVKVFRLWCYAAEDIEVCPVYHLMFFLQLTGWRDGYLFRRPLSGAQSGEMIFNYSQSDALTVQAFYRTYNKEFTSVFYDTEYKCSCHGPRRSMAQLMDRMGFSLVHIMAQCLWKNPKDAMKYIANSRVDMELLPAEHRREFPKPKPVHL